MKEKIKAKKNNGFTLVEVLLYVMILSAMTLTISVLLFLVFQARVKGQTIAEVEQNGQRVMQIVAQTIRNADSITSPTIGTSAKSLTLVVPTSTKNPTIFSLSGSTIQIKEGSNANVALSNSRVVVSDLNIFSNLSQSGTPGTIKIQFTLSHLNPSGRNEYDYSETFYGSSSLR
ncbi:MAG: hypothetical protein US30_C0007G0049 [Candidatus Moranbacteria bacterium GW2011_GWF2_36_839]|nr:MAG: hypothetical protein US27_C0007G0001 [Candidatus Moranbacteria bacterium GW2011_GWF1_36_78]KKQ17103.1 MAG: hypothetical protein US30_C0007G0049 [Candidatus Moranbacteria bacterium GW2011_GWF2_36_839]HAT73707.1 hypothetical protein [Candidatus Moranbacteria bacterium]HBY11318.1 hypothetical protein [Candidatus Moranbacteria bacterium]